MSKTSFPKDKIKVLLLENIAQAAVEMFEREGFQVEQISKLSDDQLIEKIKNVHAIGYRSKTKMRKHILAHASKLLCIGHFCIGTDQCDLEDAAKLGIPVFNSPFANTRSVAELVTAEMVMLARKVPDRIQEMHNKTWKKSSKGCHEVRGKTLGIVGYGHVGSQTSILAEGMGMNVIFYDIVPKLALGNASSVASLDELLEQSDFVTLHVPFDQTTENMIGAAQVAQMKSGSYLLNAARGKVVEVQAVADALHSGHLAGAAFDVYPSEPAPSTEGWETPLQGCPNTILTPHIGGATEEAQSGIGTEVATKLIKFINEAITVGAVNFPEINQQKKSTIHRISNVHHNQPGVLRAINEVLADYNVTAQSLGTQADIGYMVVDLEQEVSEEARQRIFDLDASIRTRVMF